MKVNEHGLRVEIEAEAWECIHQWAQLAEGEFSCLGEVDDDLYINQVHLLEQESTDVGTELDSDAIAKLLVSLPAPEKVRAWVHSHGSLGVFWSHQDNDCIDGLANDSLLISLVVNKAREYRCRVDVFKPVRITIDQVPVVVRVRSPRLHADCATEFRQKVREVPLQVRVLPAMKVPYGMSAYEEWLFDQEVQP